MLRISLHELRRDKQAKTLILTGVTLATSILLAVIFFRLVQALTHSERFGNAGFEQLVGDLKET
jgi:hypothetical protein